MTDVTRERAASAIPSLLSMRPGDALRKSRTGRLWSMPVISAAIMLMLFFAVFLERCAIINRLFESRTGSCVGARRRMWAAARNWVTNVETTFFWFPNGSRPLGIVPAIKT